MKRDFILKHTTATEGGSTGNAGAVSSEKRFYSKTYDRQGLAQGGAYVAETREGRKRWTVVLETQEQFPVKRPYSKRRINSHTQIRQNIVDNENDYQ